MVLQSFFLCCTLEPPRSYLADFIHYVLYALQFGSSSSMSIFHFISIENKYRFELKGICKYEIISQRYSLYEKQQSFHMFGNKYLSSPRLLILFICPFYIFHKTIVFYFFVLFSFIFYIYSLVFVFIVRNLSLSEYPQFESLCFTMVVVFLISFILTSFIGIQFKCLPLGEAK